MVYSKVHLGLTASLLSRKTHYADRRLSMQPIRMNCCGDRRFSGHKLLSHKTHYFDRQLEYAT
jgi:hypothetical protein